MDPLYSLFSDLKEFYIELGRFLIRLFRIHFIQFEEKKGIFVTSLYKQRGRRAQRLIHSGMLGLTALGFIIAPMVAQEFPGRSVNPWDIQAPSEVLSASTENPEIATSISEKGFRDKIIKYAVQQGDTVSSVAQKFGVSADTVRWQNNITSKDNIKVGQELEILPLTGIAHKVQKGDSVESIAKKYDSSSQAVVDFPFNTFANDETFELAVGQIVIVPDGVKPLPQQATAIARIKQITPDAGSVVASGNFVWPNHGVITQYYAWYHPGIDIANPGLPPIYAADSGKVIVAGWPDNSGYGNRVVIDHGNGMKTLYAHLSQIYVVPGQTVVRGSVIGKEGSTGRSTGPHLHFEVYQNGVRINPLGILK